MAEITKQANYQNKVYLGSDGFVHVVYLGKQTAQTIKENEERIWPISEELAKRGKPVLMLHDLTKLGKPDSSIRKAGFEAVKSLKYDRIALFGMNTFIKYIANFVIKAAAKESKVGVFANEEEAKKWLLL